MSRYFFWVAAALVMGWAVALPGAGIRVAHAAQDIESFFRNNVFYIRNNTNRRVMCQVSGMVARGSGFGTQPGLEPFQKSVVIFPNSEEAPFSGPVGSPRVFDCKFMG